LGTLGKGAVPTRVAIQAGHVMMKPHTIADPKSLGARANFHNGPGRFMSEHTRRIHCPVVNLLDVRRTHAAGTDPHENVVRGDTGHGQRFQAQVVRTAIDDGLHVLRQIHVRV
jgi:hypothetical protein